MELRSARVYDPMASEKPAGRKFGTVLQSSVPVKSQSGQDKPENAAKQEIKAIDVKITPEILENVKRTKFIVYDLETTGMQPCQVIQFAAMDLHANSEIDVVVKPTKKIHWAASGVHGYKMYGSTFMKHRQPVTWAIPRQTAIDQFIDFCDLYNENYTRVILIGYNSKSFDNPVLNKAIPKLKSDPALSDKLHFWDLYRNVVKIKGESYKLSKFYTREFGDSAAEKVEWHDGLADVKATRQLCRKFFNATQIYTTSENYQDYYG